MSKRKESRHQSSGVVRNRPDHTAREGDDRTRNRRLADVRRGNESRHQLELLTSAQGGTKKHSSTPSSWRSESRAFETLSVKEKREIIFPKPPALEARHSCPALPAISPSLGLYHDISNSTMQSPKAGSNRSLDVSANFKTKKMKQDGSLNRNLLKDEQRIVRTNSLDIIATSQHPSSRAASKYKMGKLISNLTSVPAKNHHAKSIQNESKPKRTLSVPDIIYPSQSSETRLNVKEADSSSSNKDGKETGPAILTRRRYSVLLNGGTLATNAPYVDRIESKAIGLNQTPKGETNHQRKDLDSDLQNTTTDSVTAAKGRKDLLQKPTTVPLKRESVHSPSRRRGRHLRSHKELFAFQQDLLLPRYRKLAGISGNDADDAMPQNEERSADAKTRRSDAREVFEKVRLIIKGPDKVETVTKPTGN